MDTHTTRWHISRGLITALFALLCFACSKSPQEKVIGLWQKESDPSATIEIGAGGALSLHNSAMPGLVLGGRDLVGGYCRMVSFR